MEKFEFWQSERDKKWYFHLVAPNGRVIVQSHGYTSQDDCLSGIKSVKIYAPTALIYQK
jgi:uncharacterized protein YegP (UPF0339 family)